MESKFKLGAAGIIIRQNKLLLVHQNYGNFRWILPGGHVEPHELPLEAAIREIYEETKLKVNPAGLIAVRNLVNEQVNNTSLIYLMNMIDESEPEADGQEIDQVRFFSREEIMHLDQIATWLRLFALNILKGQIKIFQHQDNPEKLDYKFEVFY
ncbi:NUDIX hydrolase [candidate division KSB1 bacterium]|nr:NUDIX hydrolase [candidate division KSB1 bacterium]